MTRQDFINLYNAKRQATMEQGYFPHTFPEYVKKTTKKAVYMDVVDHLGRPERVKVQSGVSKLKFNTSKNTELYQIVWEWFLGTECKRIESEGRARGGRNGKPMFRIKSSNKGHSDLKAMYKGMTYYIEVKQPKEKHLPSQIDFCRWVNAGGGHYHTVRSFEDMYELVQSILRGEPKQSEQI